MACRSLIVVLGDQLTRTLASLRDCDPAQDRVLMAEVVAETAYVPHHPKKIAFVLSAMRHFADTLRDAGVPVTYRRLDAPGGPCPSLRQAVAEAAAAHRPARIVVTFPGEWRVWADIRGWQAATGVPVEVREDDRFLASRAEFAAWAEGRKQLRMEYFYREMRRKTGLLMTEGGEPVGGRWNYDADNRKPLPADLAPPPIHAVAPDTITEEVLAMVEARFCAPGSSRPHFGDLHPFVFGTTRDDALRALDRFIDRALPQFGDYQDAMRQGDDWLFHSVISLYLNVGLLDPREVCAAAEAAWGAGRAPLNAVEGFVRQIIGWREYVRGLYWLKMPDYAETNTFGHTRPLPAFYWTGETDLNCLAQVIGQTRRQAYAHHIQRLMVTGTFALLAGIDPAEVNTWYLAVYADAFEWVELPNTHGMALYADGGLLASKPYAASGAYIDRMSDYCRSCRFKVKDRTGPDACPFNYLYWHFLIENRDRLSGNPRMGMVYRTLDKMKPDRVAALRRDARAFLSRL